KVCLWERGGKPLGWKSHYGRTEAYRRQESRERFRESFPFEDSALKRERRKLREMTCRKMCFKPLPKLIGEVNEHLRGWANYFGYGYPRQGFRKINRYVRERLTRHAKRKSQRPFRPPHGVSYYEQFKRMGLIYL
ncbi:MAG: group II intron maturase-specific domain-containing protein, partial [Alphaproteobacteria bacterium]